MRISDWSSDVCSSDLVPGTQAKFAYLIGRYINIVRASKIIGFRTAQKTKAVGQDLNGAKAHDLLAIFGFHLQDREHEILFAKSRSPFHPQLLRHGDEFGGRFLLRSEGHTSELQSLMRISYAVFCLKNKNTKISQPCNQESDTINALV